MPDLLTILIIAGVVFFIAILAASYVKAKPNEALIITGPKASRVVMSKGTLRIPFITRMDSVPLTIRQVDIKTASPVPTSEFINIFVDAVGNFRVIPDEINIKLAGQLFLRHSKDEVKTMVQEVLEGNMREIIGQMNLTQLVHERDAFANKVEESTKRDMSRMGLEIVTLNVQNFKDSNGVIEDLGIDNIEQIRKAASIAKAEARRDVQIAESEAAERANEARITAELLIAEQNTNLDLKKAALKSKAETEKATADAAYSIRQAEESQKINVAEQNALIARKEKEIELKEREVEVQEKFLDATIRKQAEAEKAAEQSRAEAQLYKRTKDAEAKLAEETNQAKAIEVKASADLTKQSKEAEAIKLVAEAKKEAALAEAQGIEAIGKATADAILEKAEAMKQMEQAAVLGLILDSDVFPKMVAAASKPMEKIGSIVMLGENKTSEIAGGVMNTVTQVSEGLKASGIDLMGILSGALGGAVATKVIDKKEEKVNKV